MTDAEMACCKKMAGNCDMGAGNHSCCKTTINLTQSSAVIVQHQQVSVSPFAVSISTLFSDSNAGIACDPIRVTPTPIPISPPGLQAILRI
jgi:hypothetical protein